MSSGTKDLKSRVAGRPRKILASMHIAFSAKAISIKRGSKGHENHLPIVAVAVRKPEDGERFLTRGEIRAPTFYG